MRIAVQCALLSRRGGGLPAAVLPVAARLAGTHEVTLVTCDPPDVTPEGVALRVLGARGPLVPGAARALRGIAPEVVHTHGLWTGLSVAARRTGGVRVVSPHGMLEPWALSQSAARKRIALGLVERGHMAGAGAIHALTEAEARDIRALGLTAPVAVIPNGVDPAPLSPPPPPAWIDRPTLLFLGRLHPKKGLAELVRAFGAASGDLPGWRLAIAGWEDGMPDLRQLAAEVGQGADIVFPGPLHGDAKAAALAHAAAFVLPSRSEGLPMTVLEAWAAGCPVLMTDACNLPEGFGAGAAARIETEPTRMAKAFRRHLPDAAWRRAAGAAGRALVARDFAWDTVAVRFDALYAHLAGRGPAPDFLRTGAGA